jgi:phage protein D
MQTPRAAHRRPEQAKAKARARLYRENTKQNEGNITIPGNTLLVAGINIMLTGLGVLSGKYHVLESVHKIDRGSGYVTDVKIKRVGGVKDKKQQQAKPRKKVAKAPSQAVAQPVSTPNRDNINFKTLQ